jgi:hypothetical protein
VRGVGSAGAADRNDVDQALDPEVVRVGGQQRQAGGRGSGGDLQVGPPRTWITACDADERRKDAVKLGFLDAERHDLVAAEHTGEMRLPGVAVRRIWPNASSPTVTALIATAASRYSPRSTFSTSITTEVSSRTAPGTSVLDPGVAEELVGVVPVALPLLDIDGGQLPELLLHLPPRRALPRC